MFNNLNLRYVALAVLVFMLLIPVDTILVPSVVSAQSISEGGVQWNPCSILAAKSRQSILVGLVWFISLCFMISFGCWKQVAPLWLVITALVSFVFFWADFYGDMVEQLSLAPGCHAQFAGPFLHLWALSMILLYLQHLDAHVTLQLQPAELLSINPV